MIQNITRKSSVLLYRNVLIDISSAIIHYPGVRKWICAYFYEIRFWNSWILLNLLYILTYTIQTNFQSCLKKFHKFWALKFVFKKLSSQFLISKCICSRQVHKKTGPMAINEASKPDDDIVEYDIVLDENKITKSVPNAISGKTQWLPHL